MAAADSALLARAARLRAGLARRYHVVEKDYAAAGRVFRVAAPSNPDDLFEALIDAGPNDPAYRDERIPYWAEVWPSAPVLAQFAAEHPRVRPGARVLELGCGLGLAGLAAMARGADVFFTDYALDALRFAQLNALANVGRAARTALMDWRAPCLNAEFEVILASDVAYERRFFAPLLDACVKLLAADGVVLLSEPNRRIAREFFGLAEERGLRCIGREAASPRVTVYEMARARRGGLT